MSTRHQDYLYHSRRKRLARIFRFAGETNRSTSKARNVQSTQMDSYSYYDLSVNGSNEKKDYAVWVFMSLPLIVIFAIFLNPILGLLTSFLSLGSIGVFFWRKFR